MMNFPPFGGHFSTTLPTIHQFAAKFTQETSPPVSTTAPNHLCTPHEAIANNNRYTANGIPSFTQHHHANPQPQVLTTLNNSKCPQAYPNHTAYLRQDKRYEPQELAQELCAAMLHDKDGKSKQQQGLIQQEISSTAASTTPWQSLTNSNSTVVDYLSQLPTSTLPLSLHHFLKYSAENLKKENAPGMQNNIDLNLLPNNVSNVNMTNLTTVNTAQLQGTTTTAKKKKKKKVEKEKKPKPKPGEIRLTTALDGSTLYCCPECHMAYPEKELLEQHLLGHTMERRFVCDICGAGLKRKDHLTRHKQSHNPERPYVCSVCLKAFKRKEQLTLHFVIHSGEKRHVCTECGKGFYRKDHLRKHTRSHIARRVKAELSQQGTSGQSQVLQLQVPAPTANSSSIMP